MLTKIAKKPKLHIFMLSLLSLLFVSGCLFQSKDSKPKKYFRDLDYKDLTESKKRLLAQGNKETAIKHIEKMIPLCDNIKDLRALHLELSDLLFDTGNLKGAEQQYSQFVQQYPGDTNIEYASYKAILCNYWLTLDSQRDQTRTEATITLSKKFLKRSDIFHKYDNEVEKILVDCQNKSLESEINIFKFYLHMGDELSAKTRLANIGKEFLQEMPLAEPELLILECELAQTFNRQELLLAKQTELKTKYPDYQEQKLLLAENKNKKTLFVDKF